MDNNLAKRFQKYLEKELKALPDTKEASDFRAELMDNLLSRAFDLKNQGIADDDVYVICIDSLGDFSPTLKELTKNPLNMLRDNRFWLNILYASLYVLVMSSLYIMISFITKRWGLTALIIFPLLFLSLYLGISFMIIRRNIALKKHITTGIIIFSLEIILIIVLYFALSFGVRQGWASPARAWSVFPFILPAGFVAEIINNLFFRKRKKINIALIIGLILTSSVSIYLLLATIIRAFHPYWLIILAGICLSLVILTLNLRRKINK